MRFGWWPHTVDQRTASYRLRCAQIAHALLDRGIDCGEWRPGMPAPAVLVLSKRYDVESLRTAERMRARYGTRLALDLCDNHFYSNKDHPGWRRRVEDLRRTVHSVDAVIASTSALADVVRTECLGVPHIAVIGDAAELPSFDMPRTPRALLGVWRLRRLHSRLQRMAPVQARRLVWFGNHASGYADGGMEDLLSVRAQLEIAHTRWPLHLTVVSNSRKTFRRVLEAWRLPVAYLPWQVETFSRVLALHGTCVIPIRCNPFTFCKTNNRVATALLHGLSVVADAIPSYEEFRPYITLNDWVDGLTQALSGSSDTVQRASSGADHVRNCFGLARIAQQWHETLEDIAAR